VTDTPALQRIVLGLSYRGENYHGWQSQLDGQTVQDQLESALGRFSALEGSPRIAVHCAGRTDTGVHALQQVAHFDTPLQRDMASWVRGVNRYLPSDIAVRWARAVPGHFHCRSAAQSRRYVYLLLDSPVRPSLGADRVGWSHRPLDAQPMQQAADYLLGEHDFSSFRAAACQALSPVKNLTRLHITRQGSLILCEFEANAFLHHMVRNIMGCLVAVGQGKYPPQWLAEVLAARSRQAAAPTFSAAGLYFLGGRYAPEWGLPDLNIDLALPAALLS
jgi:tRNA pseudouridine38-40 synthase